MRALRFANGVRRCARGAAGDLVALLEGLVAQVHLTVVCAVRLARGKRVALPRLALHASEVRLVANIAGNALLRGVDAVARKWRRPIGVESSALWPSDVSWVHNVLRTPAAKWLSYASLAGEVRAAVIGRNQRKRRTTTEQREKDSTHDRSMKKEARRSIRSKRQKLAKKKWGK